MKVGVIGLGGMGRGHARVVRGLEFVTQVIGCDLSQACRDAAQQDGLTTVVPRIEDLLALKPDAVLVVTAPSAHAACIRPCLEAGIPVLTEKPLTTDLAEGAALVALAQTQNVGLQVGFELRYCGLTRGMKAIVDSGLIGLPCRMSLIQNSGHHPQRNRMVRERCGGIFYEKLCHQVDLFRFWLGEPERVMAISGPQVIQHYTIPDNVHACLLFPGGRTGTIAFNTARAAHAGGTDDHGDRGHFYELGLTCAKGSITFDGWKNTLEVVRFNHRDDLKSELVESIPVKERYGDPVYALASQDHDFLQRVLNRQPLQFPASDAQKSMEWVAKAERSLAFGGTWIA